MEREHLERTELQREKIKGLLASFYDSQKVRIATGNRIVASFNCQLGVKPGEKIEEASEKEALSMIKVLKDDYKRITDCYVENSISIKKAIAKNESDLKLVKTDLDYKYIEQYMHMLDTESSIQKLIAKEVESHPMWDNFFADVKGCGPLMAAVCLVYLDPYKARYCSSFWKYAGLDVVLTTDKDGNEVSEGRSKKHCEMVSYTAANGETKERRSITFCPILKSKLIGVLGSCFIKIPGCKYEQIYRGYKNRLENSPRYEGYTAAHKHNMAIRYMIKMFMQDLWVSWRTLEGLEVTESYAVAKLGMKEHGMNGVAI